MKILNNGIHSSDARNKGKIADILPFKVFFFFFAKEVFLELKYDKEHPKQHKVKLFLVHQPIRNIFLYFVGYTLFNYG